MGMGYTLDVEAACGRVVVVAQGAGRGCGRAGRPVFGARRGAGTRLSHLFYNAPMMNRSYASEKKPTPATATACGGEGEGRKWWG